MTTPGDPIQPQCDPPPSPQIWIARTAKQSIVFAGVVCGLAIGLVVVLFHNVPLGWPLRIGGLLVISLVVFWLAHAAYWFAIAIGRAVWSTFFDRSPPNA